MEIRGVGGIGGVNNNNKINRVNEDYKTKNVDSDKVQISEEAKIKAEMSKIEETVKNAPDIREDRIAEVKAKMERGDYNNEEVLMAVADRLMKVLGL